MYKKYYWTMESWGNGCPPKNACDIIDAANGLIDEYVANNPDDPEYELQAFCEKLWENFCYSGEIAGITAQYTVDAILEKIRVIENAMERELKKVVSYYRGIDGNNISYELCWTQHAKTVSEQNAAKASIITFGQKHGAISIDDNGINVITLTFPV